MVHSKRGVVSIISLLLCTAALWVASYPVKAEMGEGAPTPAPTTLPAATEADDNSVFLPIVVVQAAHLVDVPITGLTAASSPTKLDTATYFTATISGGTNVTYAWSFGDGGIGSGANPTHTYAAVGSYTAIVTATNSLSSASAATAVTVVDVPITGLTAAGSPTKLDTATYFTATISGGTNVTYVWSFGDGGIGSGANPTHTYAAVGSYTAIVTATNSLSSASAATAVTVEPWLVDQWLSKQQVDATGLLPNQQDITSTTYVNALAVMAFTLDGNPAKAKRILDFFNSKPDEFFGNEQCLSFDSACGTSALCGENHPCGFFQSRRAGTGVPTQNANRWMGDNAWLLMAIHHYQAATGDASYDPMARAIVHLLRSLEELDGHIASGWEEGDQTFNHGGIPEGNLDAYKALSLYGETQLALRVKAWLDFTHFSENGSSAWKKGALDLHSWRVLSLGKEYGFCLPDTERTDDNTIRTKSTITYNNSLVTGFLPYPYNGVCPDNIWSEGTGGMALSFYKAGYTELGNFYAGELEKLLFEPVDFAGTQALAYMALTDPCHDWAHPAQGHVAGVAWYIFAKRRFDPFAGVVINDFAIANPRIKLEAENYDNRSSNRVRDDGTGTVSEGNAIHVGGDDGTPGNESDRVEYKFNVVVPVTIATVKMRYADDVGGDTGKFLLDGNLIGSFETVDTGIWSDYVLTEFPLATVQLQPGLHTWKVEVADKGTYGLTADYFRFDMAP